MRPVPFFALLAILSLSACGSSASPCEAGSTCPQDVRPGDTLAPDSTSDSPAPDVSTPGALGAPCMLDSDCASHICLSIGRCTQPCMGRSDCPVGNNWSCAGIPGRGTVCDCVPNGTMGEIPCNSIDDDCDGVIDNGDTTCGGMCTSLQTDSHNCGACGIACAGGSTCQGGMCNCPPLAATVCGTVCVNTNGDIFNCGACSNVCPTYPNALSACAGGMCMPTCDSGFGDCDHMAANGCEADTRASTTNCGMCGHACVFANASATCSTGTCVMGACSAGYSDCNASSLDGCESHTATDLANCGACGNACNAAHAVNACSGGVCSLVSCMSGYGDCDSVVADGCEVSLLTDTANCGVCGGACPARANATTTCTTGSCGFTCVSGFADCDGVASNGCETSITTVSHCGSCTTVCPPTEMCGGGVCSTCPPGEGLCGGTCIGVTSDPLNCGTCGHVCPAGASCSASTCVCPSGDVVCGSACTNTSNDPANCGACGSVCPVSLPTCALGG